MSKQERDKQTIDNLSDALEQACYDLNEAHDTIMRLQGIDNPEHHDYPDWTSQSYTIRWAEKLLDKPLSKTSILKARNKRKEKESREFY